MSYINEALRKAQRERDNRYGQFGGIIAACPSADDRFRKRRSLLFAAAAALLLVSALLLFAVRAPQPSPAVTKAPLPAAAAVALPPAAGPLELKAAPSSAAGGTSGGAQAAGDAELRYEEALLAQRKGELKQAELLYRQVLKLDPGHVRSLNNLGVVYMVQKRWEKAVAILGRAVVLKKDYIDPYYNLACLYAQKNETGESLWYLKMAARIDGGALKWATKDPDMKNVVASPEFKKLMEGQKN
ncbi:MAG: tetratricopeptide repeat protein [Deltaproteobacteria bacterium]|nr:tetratricopeptide repeat protein [Deltaproteobacteria bacterium]